MGAELALAARLVLGAAFLVSALAKLRRGRALVGDLRSFGAPAPELSAKALPAAEVALAAVLLALPDAAWPPLVAMAVLGLFTGAVVANLSRGRAVPCPCFGAGEEPVSTATVARNGWLAGLAVLGTGSAGDASVPGALALAAALAVVTVLVVRRTG